jgi:cation:H+ antiporter
MDALGIDLSQLPILANIAIVVATILIITKGAQWLVEAAAAIAVYFGVSELVVGLTVVAFGTSAPEFAVTLTAAFRNQGDISVGNIVGSNVFNLGFILGGCAAFRAIPTSLTLFKRDGPFLVISALLLFGLVGLDLHLDRLDGPILAGMLVAYLVLLFKQRRKSAQMQIEPEEEPSKLIRLPRLSRDAPMLVGGLLLILGGSRVLVDSATAVARSFGISEWVIGVTIVAAGTSAPELATTLVGVMKRRFDISAGNLIGSDIFNLLGVLGLAGILRPVEVDPVARYSILALAVMVAMVMVFMRTGWRISRLEGVLLVLIALARWCFDALARMPR